MWFLAVTVVYKRLPKKRDYCRVCQTAWSFEKRKKKKSGADSTSFWGKISTISSKQHPVLLSNVVTSNFSKIVTQLSWIEHDHCRLSEEFIWAYGKSTTLYHIYVEFRCRETWIFTQIPSFKAPVLSYLTRSLQAFWRVYINIWQIHILSYLRRI